MIIDVIHLGLWLRYDGDSLVVEMRDVSSSTKVLAEGWEEVLSSTKVSRGSVARKTAVALPRGRRMMSPLVERRR